MRIRAAVTAVLFTVVVAAGVACQRQLELRPLRADPAQVAITVTCADGAVAVTVSPWQVAVERNQPVEWTATVNGQPGGFSIRNVPGSGQWPYLDAPPYHSDSNGKARPRQSMNPNAHGRYRYAITTSCSDPTVGLQQILIDPDMILPY